MVLNTCLSREFVVQQYAAENALTHVASATQFLNFYMQQLLLRSGQAGMAISMLMPNDQQALFDRDMDS